MQANKLKNWLKHQKNIKKIKINKKKISNLKDWIFKKNVILNSKQNFFSIKAFIIKCKNKITYQPLIVQKENGIIGINKKKKDNKDYYLLQAKIEPGNINGIQISPTVQATKSNYLRKHGGKKTLFLNFFIKTNNQLKIISKKKLSEQGSRFLKKKNWNILIEAKNPLITNKDNYRWLTRDNLKYLANKKNILNMDTLSVMSSIIQKNANENTLRSNKQIQNKLNNFIKKNKIKRLNINFKDLNNWVITKDFITDIKKKFFSILFIDVYANSREIKKWEQPIISDHFSSLNGFLICKYNNTVHYLLQLVNEPGLDNAKYTSTIFEKNFSSNLKKKIKYFYFFSKKNLLLDVVNSDEGGRFLKNQIRNIICEIKDFNKINLTENFIWASHNQVVDLIANDKMTIESRNLFASYNIDKIY